uniref:hypothetical protein n=1 Tax=Streptomyces virginiae TaxID=1961 RepID=UPI002F913F71
MTSGDEIGVIHMVNTSLRMVPISTMTMVEIDTRGFEPQRMAHLRLWRKIADRHGFAAPAVVYLRTEYLDASGSRVGAA